MSKSKSKKKPTAELATTTTDTPTGSQEQYAKYLPEALKIPTTEVRPLRADVSLAIINCARGVNAVLENTAAGDLESALPQVSIDALHALSDLAGAVAYAAGQVERFAPPTSDVKELMARAQKLRGLLLASADVLVLANVFTAAAVAKIRQGRGPIDAAGDCVALAALFHKHAIAIRGKVPVTPADVTACAQVGTQLLQVLRPVAAKRAATAKELVAAVDARDRLWTLLERTWEANVWRAGAWLYGRAVDEHVPPLGSRVVGKRPKLPPPLPPVPPPPLALT